MPQMKKGGKFIFGQSIIQGQKTRRLRAGVYLFAIMEWVSAIGYRMFPLSDSGYAGAFQDMMHMVVTALVVLLSIVSLSVIVSAGLKDKSCRSYGICATVALGMMLVDENRACAVFWRGGALQRLCRYGLQCRAGHSPVLHEG